MSVLPIRVKFIETIDEVEDLISFAFERNRSRRYKLSLPRRKFIIESAFLKLFIGWEEFLEAIFHAYLVGTPSDSGSVTNCYLTPVDEDHAKQVLIGTQKYVDWSNPDIVRRLSKLYFGNINVIDSGIAPIHSDIFDLKIIRNSAAHLSSTTVSKLQGLKNRLFGQGNSVNDNAYSVLMAVSPSDPTVTIMKQYTEKLSIASDLMI